MVPPDHPEGGGIGRLYSDSLWGTPNIQHPTSNFEPRKAGKGHPKPPRGECRRKNAECRRAGKATLKPSQCDIKATPMRVGSQAVGTPKPPQGHPKATLKRLQSHPKAPTRLQQSQPENISRLTRAGQPRRRPSPRHADRKGCCGRTRKALLRCLHFRRLIRSRHQKPLCNQPYTSVRLGG